LVLLGHGLIYFFGCLPRWLCLACGRALGYAFYFILQSRARVAVDNLKLVYGDSMTAAERRRLARRNFGHWGGVLLELFQVAARGGRLDKILRVEGLEHLQAAARPGRGAVLFSAHLGNFIFLPTALRDYPEIKFLYRKPTDATAEELYRWLRERLRISVISDNPRELSALQCVKHVARRGILGVLIDQVEIDGVYVDFMGHPAGSTIGAAALALRRRIPLVPVRCVRQLDQSWVVTVEPEYTIRREGAYEQCLEEAVAGMNKVVERWVRENPEQWFWAHRRWRAWKK
jgi:Kdo2-lipid IVA lauroyltransferase/acyltransferase